MMIGEEAKIREKVIIKFNLISKINQIINLISILKTDDRKADQDDGWRIVNKK